MQQQDQQAQTPTTTPTTTTTTTTKPTVQQSSAKKLVDMNLSEEEMFGSRRGTGNAFEFENKKLGDKWWNKSWIPVRKYKAGREFGKFFVYMLFPFAVILITGQPAIKEYIVMRSKHKIVYKSSEQINEAKDMYDEEGEDNTYFDLQEKNKKRVERFLKLQKATEEFKEQQQQQQQQDQKN